MLWTWDATDLSELADVASTGVSRTNLVIMSNTLPAGRVYTFTLTADGNPLAATSVPPPCQKPTLQRFYPV